MHRHGYSGRKFHRERDQRDALIKSLAEALVKNTSIETTLPKAKELVPYVEKLITKAKKGDLHSRRQVISGLQTVTSAHKLVDEIAPKLKARNSGFLRIGRTRLRRGDNAQLAQVSFVDDVQSEVKPEAAKAKSKASDKKPTKSTAPTSLSKPDQPAATSSKATPKPSAAKVVGRRTGVRGNK